MKINFNQALTDVKGEKIDRLQPVISMAQFHQSDGATQLLYTQEGSTYKIREREFSTLKTLAVDALSSWAEGDEKLPPVEKYERGKLAIKIHESNGEPLEITAEDIAKLKPLIARVCLNPVTVTRAFNLLESAASVEPATRERKK